MAGYATKTNVSVAQSKAEIEQLLNRFGIYDVIHGTTNGMAAVMFAVEGKQYRIALEMPKPDDEEFRFTPSRGLERTTKQQQEAWEQACRVKWREVALLLKAKLVAISNEAATFDNEFLAYQMLPDGRTVSEMITPDLEAITASGKTPALAARFGIHGGDRGTKS